MDWEILYETNNSSLISDVTGFYFVSVIISELLLSSGGLYVGVYYYSNEGGFQFTRLGKKMPFEKWEIDNYEYVSILNGVKRKIDVIPDTNLNNYLAVLSTEELERFEDRNNTSFDLIVKRRRKFSGRVNINGENRKIVGAYANIDGQSRKIIKTFYNINGELKEG